MLFFRVVHVMVKSFRIVYTIIKGAHNKAADGCTSAAS
jgi:hypothetical protein